MDKNPKKFSSKISKTENNKNNKNSTENNNTNNNNKKNDKKTNDKLSNEEETDGDVNLLAENISELRMNMENIRNNNN